MTSWALKAGSIRAQASSLTRRSRSAHGDPRDLVVRGEPAAILVPRDHRADLGQALGGDRVPGRAAIGGLGQQLRGVLLSLAGGLTH